MSDLSELDLGSKRLRPYQCELIEKVRNLVRQGRRRIIVNSPTGSGKTVLGCGLIKLSSQRGKYSMFMAPRRELIKQTAAHLYDCDVRFSVIAAGFEQMSGSECFIVSKDTLASRTLRRKKIEIPKTQLLLHDECHTSVAKEAMLLLTAIEQANPGLVTIGLSATPGRSDGKGLGDFWEEIVTAASYESLISQGFLVSTRVFAPDCPNMKGVRSIDWDSEAAKRVDKPRLVGDVIQHWIKFGESRKTIAFGATVSHAVHLRDEFLKAGIPAACLDQSTPMDERDQMIDDLKSGRIQVLCNCDVLSVGFDEPSVGCVVLAAPTRSLVRYRQRAGRALRPHPDKGGNCIILDHSGAVFMHGFPDEDIEWPLEKSRSIDQEYQKKRGEGKTKEPIVCQVCSCTYSGLPACPNCGSRQYRTGRSIAIERGLLKEIKREKKKPVVNSFEQKQKYWNQCLAVMARKGRTCGAAARMYSRAIGSSPWNTKGLQRVPKFGDWKKPVAEVYPNFAPKVQNEPE